MRTPFLLLSLLLVVAPVASAASVKLLLPVVLHTPVPGGYNSLWSSQATILNVSDHAFFVVGVFPPCGFDPCIQPQLVPGTTMPLTPGNVTGDVPGTFLLVDSAERNNVKVELRIQDLSRQLQTWGTDVPVIDEANAAQQAVNLLDVTIDPAFRSLVRVYDFDPAAGHAVVMRIFQPDSAHIHPDVLVAEVTVPLRVPINAAQNPGYAEVSLTGLTGLPSSGTVRIEIAPVLQGLRFWAFASVTNNDTQHVTLVTP